MISKTYKNLSDPELIALCLQGESAAWEALIHRYKRLIYSVPARFSFSPSDSADVFQSVCVKLIEHLQDLKDENRVSGWILTTTTRQCIHFHAMRRRDGPPEEEFQEPPDPSDSLEAVKIQTEAQLLVRESVEKLPERCRNLLELLYFDTKSPSYDEIGAKLGIPTPSIGPTRARCLEKLRIVLRRKGIT